MRIAMRPKSNLDLEYKLSNTDLDNPDIEVQLEADLTMIIAPRIDWNFSKNWSVNAEMSLSDRNMKFKKGVVDPSGLKQNISDSSNFYVSNRETVFTIGIQQGLL